MPLQKTAAAPQVPEQADLGQVVLAVPRGPACKIPCKIPKSSPRAEPLAFAKLLSRVDPKAVNGLGFDGVILRPGATIPEATLWPTEEFPSTPLLLEYAGRVRISGRGRDRDVFESLYILWRWSCERRAWEELARSHSESWQWAIDLRPVALRALAESNGGVEVLPCLGLDARATRLAEDLDRELEGLEPQDCILLMGKLGGILHDRVAGKLAQLQEP